MDFGDQRLNKRLGILLTAFTENTEGSIPEACKSKAATKGAYRLLSNGCVEAKKIRDGFRVATIERMKELPKGAVVLFASDASNIVFTSHKKLKGIGVLRNQKARGLNLHSTLVYTEDELLLGAVRQDCWGRKPEDYGKRKERSSLPIEQKESYRWIEAFNAAQEALIDKLSGIFMADRGGDIYDLFLIPIKSNMSLLIRSLHDRKSADSSQKIFDEVAGLPSSGIMTVIIKRSGERKERIAKLEIRFKAVTIAPPTHRKELPKVENFCAISAREIADETNNKQELISWDLLTTLSIKTLEDAIYAVVTYAKRWLIERFHYTLKEGCKVEELQLEEAERIDKAIAAYTIVSWRIMYMTYLARISPKLPCTKIFGDIEWKALCCYSSKTSIAPNDPPLLKDAILFLAKMGGFLGRRRDGEPGVKVIWRGLRILEGAAAMYAILKGESANNATLRGKDVGNA